MQSNKTALAERGWHPCNRILLKDRDAISTKRPADYGLKHTLTTNSRDNIIYSKIIDEDACNSRKDNNHKEIETKQTSFYFDKHELINNNKNTCKDTKVKTNKTLNISQGHAQKCLAEIFQCDANIETAHS